MRYFKLASLFMVFTMLAACGGSSNSSSNDDDPADNDVDVALSQSANDEPVDITDAESVGAELVSRFGAANGEPIPVDDGDTVASILAK